MQLSKANMIEFVNLCSPNFGIIYQTGTRKKTVAVQSAQWASLGVEMDKNPGGHFLDILCCK